MKKLILFGALLLTTFSSYGQSILLPAESQLYMKLNDNLTHRDKKFPHYGIGWVNDSWFDGANTLWMSSFGGIKFFTKGSLRLAVKESGNVGIGMENPQFKLDVEGSFRAKDFVLRSSSTTNGWRLSHFYYEGHTLRIGPSKGSYATTVVDIVPGTSSLADVQSQLSLYSSNKEQEYLKKVQINTAGNSFFNGGNVGIGTENPKNKLDVAGTIRAQEIKVELEGWADYVFDKDYKLPSLSEVENHIQEHKRLPEIPSEADVKENGISLGEMQVKLLQKIEELTLYTIEQNKKVEELNLYTIQQDKRIEELEKQLKK